MKLLKDIQYTLYYVSKLIFPTSFMKARLKGFIHSIIQRRNPITLKRSCFHEDNVLLMFFRITVNYPQFCSPKLACPLGERLEEPHGLPSSPSPHCLSKEPLTPAHSSGFCDQTAPC